MKRTSYYNVMNNLIKEVPLIKNYNGTYGSYLGGCVKADNGDRMVRVWTFKDKHTSFFINVRLDESSIQVQNYDGWSNQTKSETYDSKHFWFGDYSSSKEMASQIAEYLDKRYHLLDGVRYL